VITTVLGAIEMRKRTRLTGLEVFLASLRATNPGTRIVLFNRSPQHWGLSQLLERFGAESINTEVFDRRYQIPQHEIEITRFLEYAQWLAENPIGAVVLADVLDVLWQGPIPEMTAHGITVFQENVIAAECPYNSKWIRAVWPETYHEIEFNPVICCGIIIGYISGIGMQTYLTAYGLELAKRTKVKRGFDSAVLAGLAHLTPKSVNVQPYLNQFCMHLGYADPRTVYSDEGLVTICEEVGGDGGSSVSLARYIPPLVHQYNRHAVTEEIYTRWST
jgi:hypothetical protein